MNQDIVAFLDDQGYANLYIVHSHFLLTTVAKMWTNLLMKTIKFSLIIVI